MKSIQLNPDGTFPQKITMEKTASDTFTVTATFSGFPEDKPEPEKDWRKEVKEFLQMFSLQMLFTLWCVGSGIILFMEVIARLIMWLIKF